MKYEFTPEKIKHLRSILPTAAHGFEHQLALALCELEKLLAETTLLREQLQKAEAAARDARRDALEEAAKWHDQRARQTPDVFETEFHEVSARAIRHLKAGSTDAMTALESALAATEMPPATQSEIERFKVAIEGECDGLVVNDAQSRVILNYVRGIELGAASETREDGRDTQLRRYIKACKDCEDFGGEVD